MKRSIRAALAVLSLLFLAFIVVAPILAHANPPEIRPMMIRKTPIFISQYIGPTDEASLKQVASCMLQELNKLSNEEQATATISGLAGIRMFYDHALTPLEEFAERQSQAVAGMRAIKNLPPSEVPAAIDRLLLELQRTEA